MDTSAGATNSSETQSDEPSLHTIPLLELGVADDFAIDVPVSEVRVTTEERFKGFEMDNVTHVVIQ